MHRLLLIAIATVSVAGAVVAYAVLGPAPSEPEIVAEAAAPLLATIDQTTEPVGDVVAGRGAPVRDRAAEEIVEPAPAEPASLAVEAEADPGLAETETAAGEAPAPAEPETVATAPAAPDGLSPPDNAPEIDTAEPDPALAPATAPPSAQIDEPVVAAAPAAVATPVAAATVDTAPEALTPPAAPPEATAEPDLVVALVVAPSPVADAPAVVVAGALAPPPPLAPAPGREPDAAAAAAPDATPAAAPATGGETMILAAAVMPPPPPPPGEPEAATAPATAEVRPRAVEAAPDMRAPSFDIVRVAADGLAVFAGRAEPGATVSVVDRDQVIGSALTDARGEWVVVPERPLPPGSRELGIVARGASGIEALSESVVVLSIPLPLHSRQAAPEIGPRAPLAVAMPRGDSGVVQLMQGGEPGFGIEGAHGLSLDSLSYDAAGRFELSGRATPENTVAAYLDAQDIGRTRASRLGDWTITPEESIDPGLYTLRIDQIGDAGTVVSHIETPFSRADIADTEVAEGLVVVQPGNSLWRIARRVYGRGVEHTIIFQANRDQIRQPELIYPGQIFVVPKPQGGE